MSVYSRYEFPELIDESGCKTGVEVGVFQGEFSYYLLKHSNLTHLTSIDSWEGKWAQREERAKSLLRRFDDRSTVLKATSEEGAAKFADESLDFVYIDADHTRAGIELDLKIWCPKVRVGGILSGHDYVRARKCAVVECVDEFMKERPEKLHVTTEWLASWYFIKEKP